MSIRRVTGRVMLAAATAMVLAGPAVGDGVHTRLQTPNLVLSPNEEFDVTFYVVQPDEPFNAFDAAIRFDPSRLSFVAPPNPASQPGGLMTGACGNTFHLFTATPDSLRVTLSLLCAGASVTGPGELYRVRFKAGTTAGTTSIDVGWSTQFYHAGFFVNPHESQNLEVCITNCTTGIEDDAEAIAFALHAPSPNPWSGPEPASFRFDMPRGGPVRVTLLDVSGRLVAAGESRWFDAGRHVLTLSRPDVRAGMYFARLQSPFGSASRPVILTW